MAVRTTCCRALSLLLLVAGSVSAEEARVKVVVSSADQVVSDLKTIVELSPNKNLKKEAKNLEATLVEGFLGGVDLTKPIRLDVVLGKDGTGYDLSVPISKLKPAKKGEPGTFFENLEGFGYKIKPQPPAADLYQLTDPNNKNAPPLYLRDLHKYALIASKAPAANAPNPIADVQNLLNAGYSIAAEMKNTAEGAETREKDFQGMRKELEAAIKFKRGEDPAEFEFRKLGTTQTFNEAQRFVVEADTVRIGWTTAEGAKSGKGDLLLTALPNTSLLASIEQLATRPNYFANVQLHANPALSGKLQFPLDPFRQEEAKTRHPIARAATKASIAQRTGLTDAGKEAALKAIDKLFDIFDASLDIGLEGFIDVHVANDRKHTFVGGMRANNTQLALEIVELLPSIREDWKVKPKVAEHGGVTIHEITVCERRRPEYSSLFGGEPILYVGVSEKAVWAACGENSLDELKAAIDQQAQPAPGQADPNFLEIAMKFGPWMDLLEVMRQQEPKKENKTKQEIEADKERDRMRQLALEAFAASDELLQGRLYRDGNDVKGEMTINEGVFRFLGSAIADFSKQNLH